ncbi:hypothetical protein CAEBREN_16570 [Caenorhabditis brenneri]|uniref:F-box domain-containing protein n=1 Tax=Caenorhabditis brenneri TaxID=135651 RepID=G0MTK7_CAEBE|nr:hypothetical protein CAEBREN_16570 [Caenorhabditis brenneri]
MTIKLQKFTYLILERIIKLMDYDAIIILSFCSTKTKELIKLTRWKVSAVTYTPVNSYIVMHIKEVNLNKQSTIIMVSVPQFYYGSETLKLPNSMQTFGLFKISKNDEFAIQVLKDFRDTAILILHRYIMDLFLAPPDIKLQITSDTDLNSIILFDNTKSCGLFGETAYANYTDQLFSKFENLQEAVVEPFVIGSLKENTILSSTKCLYFCHAGVHTGSLLLHFKGYHAVFRNSECDISVVQELLEKWIRNEAFCELKSVTILLRSLCQFQITEFHNDFDAKSFDSLRRPAIYDKLPDIMGVILEPLECTDFLDIVRLSDGRVGSYKLTPKYFQFCVWD